ncbi:hypothetical protein ACLOJK_014119 [Asimina triloba]
MRNCTWNEERKSVSMRAGGGVVLLRRIQLVVSGFSHKVDSKGDDGDAEAGSSMPQLVRQHRMLPPFVPPLEELARRTQRLRHRFSAAIVSSSFSRVPNGGCECLSDLDSGRRSSSFCEFEKRVCCTAMDGS